jgi:hypothetical protein
MSKASNLKRTLGRLGGSFHSPLVGRLEPVVSFDSHRKKAMFSCFYTAGHKAFLGRFRSQTQTACVQNSCSAN